MEFLSGLPLGWFNPVSFIPFIVVISVIVVIHELGHYSVARLFGVKVDSFSVGFGGEIAGWTAPNGTRWKICWLPLGGYVKFAGDAGPASIPDKETQDAIRSGRMVLSEDEESLFHFKPVWQRALVVAAGPAANFVLAIFIFTMLLWTLGEQVVAPRLGEIEPGSPAAEAGLQSGDVVTAVNGRDVKRFAQLREAELINPNRELELEVERDGTTMTFSVVPEKREQPDGVGGTITGGYLGINAYFPAIVGTVVEGSAADRAGLRSGDRITALDGQPVESFERLTEMIRARPGAAVDLRVERGGAEMTVQAVLGTIEVEAAGGATQEAGQLGVSVASVASQAHYGFGAALGRATVRTGDLVGLTFRFMGDVVLGRQEADQVGGPIRIAKMARDAAVLSPETLIAFIALVSVGVGIINLFPIPVLDGGHLLYYAYEGVVGKPLGPEAQEIGFKIGLVLVLALVVAVTWNDLVQLRVFEGLGDLFS